MSKTGDDKWNVILWMDHRANEQTERMNQKDWHVLRYVGGKMSPEMEMPKLLWLKESLPATVRRQRRCQIDLALVEGKRGR